jgi:acetyl-CoA acetyltransferase
MRERTLRGQAAIVGIGETPYYRHGKSPDLEFVLTLKAILAACEDAGISPEEIDGFSSFSMDRSGPVRLAAALAIRDLRYSVMQWEGGGGGAAAAVANAVSGIATGQADYVVVFRGLAQGQFGRFGKTGPGGMDVPFMSPYGVVNAGQLFAFKYNRWMHDHGGVGRKAQKAISLASYHHAQQNPRAVMYGRPLTSQGYDDSRMIVGAAAIILTSPERAKDLRRRPAYIMAAAAGANHSWGRRIHNSPTYATSNFTTIAPRLWEMAGIGPQDVDVFQSYENVTGGVVMSLVEHGLCDGEAVDDELTFDRLIAPSGRWPLNTSGGQLAEAYIHGMNLITEGVRQLRGESVNQVPAAKVALIAAGPLTAPVSDLVIGNEEVL